MTGPRQARPAPEIRRFENKVWETVQKHRMLSPGEHILVAVSGGADSTALLLCLRRLAPRRQWTLTAAHLNHGLRAEASDSDAAFVRDLCARQGIPLETGRLDVRLMAAEAKANLEETGRRERYRYLRETADRVAAGRIAVGHTRDDQAETVLQRLLRGSGSTGLAGIHPVVGDRIVRPLLHCSRREVLAYLAALGEEHRADASNLDLDFTRNRIRHELLPYLARHFNPRVVDSLVRQGETALAVSAFLRQEAMHSLHGHSRPLEHGLSLSVPDLMAVDPVLQKEVLREALRSVRGTLRGLMASHIDGVHRLCLGARSGRRTDLPGNVTVSRQLSELWLERGRPAGSPVFDYPLPVPGTTAVPELNLEIKASLCACPGAWPPAEVRAESACLDAGRVPGPIAVRSRRPGDRYGGPSSRKVKKMLIDARIPLGERGRLIMVACGDAVLWIPGFSPAKSVGAGPQTVRCVLLEVSRPDPAS